jgi:hypothetical protein
MAVRNATLLYFAAGGPAAGKPCNSDPIPRGASAFTVRPFPAQQEGCQLAHIEEPTSPPRLHPARAPPQAELDFELGAPERDEVDQEFPPGQPVPCSTPRPPGRFHQRSGVAHGSAGPFDALSLPLRRMVRHRPALLPQCFSQMRMTPQWFRYWIGVSPMPW